ncbi:MAG: Crp/Fnr family transcriptional regulator [Rhodothermaceae bacterium]|nr:Crp/Fnr family transcriptional regulator [Rhodothermaceae bacterium]
MDTLLRQRFPFLEHLAEPTRTRVLTEGRAVTLAPDSFVCMEGDACAALALLLDGRVRVYKSNEHGRALTLYRITPGGSCILTASCLLSARSFPAFAQAETTVTAWMVPASTFRAGFADDPAWQFFVNDLLAQRLADVIEVVEEVAFRRLDTRLAHQLLALVETTEPQTVRATHDTLALELGSAREVVSRLLKAFEDDGLVILGRGQIRLLDVPGLRLRAQPG